MLSNVLFWGQCGVPGRDDLRRNCGVVGGVWHPVLLLPPLAGRSHQRRASEKDYDIRGAVAKNPSMASQVGDRIGKYTDREKLDTDCAMCYWGEALVLGPNINLPMREDAVALAFAAAKNARTLAPKATPREQALQGRQTVQFIGRRSRPLGPTVCRLAAGGEWIRNFSSALSSVVSRFTETRDPSQRRLACGTRWRASGGTPSASSHMSAS